MRRMLVFAGLLIGIVGLLSGTVTASSGGSAAGPPGQVRQQFLAQNWQYPVYVTNCDAKTTKPNGCYGTSKPVQYKALQTSQIKKKWNICVSFPHLKDPYWVTADYGLAKEAKRDGVHMTLYAAAGYNDLATQVNQLDDCVANGANAVILGAISYSGLDNQIANYEKKGIVVIDGWNGVNTPKVASHALFDYYIAGQVAAKYLAGLATKEHKTLNVLVLPGPSGAGWSERTAQGFKSNLKSYPGINLLDVKYADTGKDQQLQLVENALQAYPKIDWIFGNAVAADAANIALKSANKTSTTNVMSSYMIPSVYNDLKSGAVTCSVVDQVVAYSRIAMDLAIRKLQGMPAWGNYQRIWATPQPYVACGKAAGAGNNLKTTFFYEAALFPNGFSPVFKVN
jgi:periplasmic protein TorT